MNPSNLIKSFWSYWTVGRLGIVFPLWRFSCLNMTRMHGLLLFAHVGKRERVDKRENFWPEPIFLPISKDINTLLSKQPYQMKKNNSRKDFCFTVWPCFGSSIMLKRGKDVLNISLTVGEPSILALILVANKQFQR